MRQDTNMERTHRFSVLRKRCDDVDAEVMLQSAQRGMAHPLAGADAAAQGGFGHGLPSEAMRLGPSPIIFGVVFVSRHLSFSFLHDQSVHNEL
jgi:hypothetical protein